MKEIKIQITYDEEMEELHIEDYYFNSISYMNIKSPLQIGMCISEFIKDYYENEVK